MAGLPLKIPPGVIAFLLDLKPSIPQCLVVVDPFRHCLVQRSSRLPACRPTHGQPRLPTSIGMFPPVLPRPSPLGAQILMVVIVGMVAL